MSNLGDSYFKVQVTDGGRARLVGAGDREAGVTREGVGAGAAVKHNYRRAGVGEREQKVNDPSESARAVYVSSSEPKD